MESRFLEHPDNSNQKSFPLPSHTLQFCPRFLNYPIFRTNFRFPLEVRKIWIPLYMHRHLFLKRCDIYFYQPSVIILIFMLQNMRQKKILHFNDLILETYTCTLFNSLYRGKLRLVRGLFVRISRRDKPWSEQCLTKNTHSQKHSTVRKKENIVRLCSS